MFTSGQLQYIKQEIFDVIVLQAVKHGFIEGRELFSVFTGEEQTWEMASLADTVVVGKGEMEENLLFIFVKLLLD
ncbi:hypothetical protein [Thermoflavimicrobium dichotomicum]|uniref:Uncharacterized protein n=1 Tax=Thermoflavimicrobium dichotomicum TaxID=46223 RepID=A0A1I3TWW2_9BACL|nr:hypothetical protein [Thermoflavimicrobium dichotomicum]SFJ75150.1 hypothetical protein SAMN05421852_12014 [Thermoflavimicrobium dichotomicum]